MAHCLFCSRHVCPGLGANSHSIAAPESLCVPGQQVLGQKDPLWSDSTHHALALSVSPLAPLLQVFSPGTPFRPLLLTRIPSPLRSLSSALPPPGGLLWEPDPPSQSWAPAAFWVLLIVLMNAVHQPSPQDSFHLTAGGGGDPADRTSEVEVVAGPL